MKCLYANVRSVSKNADYISLVLSRNFDIYAFSETWLKPRHGAPSIFGNLISDYGIIRCDRPQKPGGGVILVYRRSLSVSVVLRESLENAYEILCGDVYFESSSFRIIVVYRTPSCAVANTELLFKVLSDLVACELHSIIVGDFNMPEFHANGSCHSSPMSWLEELVHSHDLTQHVREPTRGSNVLDLVFTTCRDLIKNICVMPPVGVSDHNTISFDIQCRYMEAVPVYRKVYSKVKFDEVCTDLAKIRWVDLLESKTNVNDKYELFLSILHAAIETHVPWKLVSSMKSLHLPQYLQNMLMQRECLFHEAKRTDNWAAYKAYTEVFARKLKKYNNYLERTIIESGNARRFYKYLNSKIQDRENVACLMDGEGCLVTAPIDKANLLARHFEKSFQEDDGNTPSSFDIECDSMKDLPWFYPRQLNDLIKKWPSSSSITPDFVSLFFIQKTADVICGPLAYIFNQSLMFSEVPLRWKHSFVTPVLKKEPASQPENYRPISITSVFCRLFEKVIKEHILHHSLVHRIIPPEQHGFVPGRSVETNLLECINDWTEALDNKRGCDVIYFDFAKAFDRVSHKKLVYKLEKLKFHPIITKWIAEYLSGRTFQVRLGHVYSEVTHITSGVPQGGVLSPVLFDIYTADLPIALQSTRVTTKMYADDIKIYNVIADPEDASKLQNAVDLLVNWSKIWQLPLAPHKTISMHFNRSVTPQRCGYTIDGIPITEVDHVKDLGFHYNNKLDFSEHIISRCKLANLRTYQIFRGIAIKNKKVLLRAYKTYVRPLVESGTTVFCPYKKKYIQAIEKVQNNFTRKLLLRIGGFLYSRIPKAVFRNRYLELSTLASRRKVFDVCMAHKLAYGPTFAANRFFKILNSRTRGGPSKIFLTRPQSKIRAISFPFRAASSYLKVTRNMQSIPSLGHLRRRVSAMVIKYDL